MSSYESLDVNLTIDEPDDIEFRTESITTTRKVLTILVALAIIGALGVIANFSQHPNNTNIRLLNQKASTADQQPAIFIHSDCGEVTNPFAYRGPLGPKHWSRTNPFCRGEKQSPINIVTADVRGQGESGEMEYKRVTELFLHRNDHTVDVSAPGEDKDDKIIMDMNGYLLAQFHFHHPSEHTINGKHADAEVHFVHATRKDRFVVVALMCYVAHGEYGEYENRQSSRLLGYLLHKARFPSSSRRDKVLYPDNMNILRDIGLGSEMPAYEYSGSLTTPPCTEAVTWFVLKKKFYLSRHALKMLKKSFPVNNRPTQKVNNRGVRNGVVRIN